MNRRTRLDRIVERASDHLQAGRLRAAWGPALGSALPWLPGVALVLLLARWTMGLSFASPLAMLLWLGPFLAVAVAEIVRARFAAVARTEALRVADRTVAAEDRLLAADDFLGRARRGGFMEAAIEDADRFAERALVAELRARGAAARIGKRGWLCALAGVALYLAGFVVPAPPPLPARGDAAAVADAGAATPAGTKRPDEAPKDPGAAERPRAPRPPGSRTAEDSVAAQSDRYAADLPDSVRGTEARARAGQSGEGGAPSRAASSAGTPSEQEQVSRSDNKERAHTPKPKKTKRPRLPAAPKESKADKHSGVTAGRGSTSSSSRNPTTSTWSSRDKVPDADEEVDDDDEEVEDEDEDSEARGGVQPNLRDKKPPVNRDLSIGFGNRPNPAANGRGGPSQRKKSRGTASLVLGVPLPDHVRGNPNPGRTKVTQERVEPKGEKSEPSPSSPRRPRAAPAGHVARPDMGPWLKRLVREYFLSLRAAAKEEPK